MAQECRAVIDVINLLKGRDLDSSTINQLDDARYRLGCASYFLTKLEEVQPENTISTQLGALFQQAHDGFSGICNPMDQRNTSRMSKVLKIIKLDKIAERSTTASKSSKSTKEMILDVLEILNPDNIAEQIKASKPSTSSSQIITMGLVRFVDFLLDYVKNLAPMKLRYLQAFFIVTSSRCIEHESMQYLFTHVEDIAYTALQLYFPPVYSGSDQKIELLKLISLFRTDLRQIYISLLTALKSSRSETTMKSGCMLDFVNALQADLRETPLDRDEKQCIGKGLYCLAKFLKHIEYRGTPLKEFSSLQSFIEALTFEAAFVIYSYDKDLLIILQPKFNHVNVEIELIQTLNSRATMTDPLKDLIEYAWEELICHDPISQVMMAPTITHQ